MATDYAYQIALIVPDAQVIPARRIATAMGWGSNNYSCELTDGVSTYWGLSSVATQTFIDMLFNPGGIVLGEEEDPFEFAADLDLVMPVLVQSIEPVGSRSRGEQFDELCSDEGLTRVLSEEV